MSQGHENKTLVLKMTYSQFVSLCNYRINGWIQYKLLYWQTMGFLTFIRKKGQTSLTYNICLTREDRFLNCCIFISRNLFQHSVLMQMTFDVFMCYFNVDVPLVKWEEIKYNSLHHMKPSFCLPLFVFHYCLFISSHSLCWVTHFVSFNVQLFDRKLLMKGIYRDNDLFTFCYVEGWFSIGSTDFTKCFSIS